ncbi:MAG: shikimate kinase [Dehalococcoidales bacterium]|nr:shikimate kinase [Dehalococcoidales bacterium]
MKNNIALIGFMGTGKTTVGKVLARKLGMNFIELDSLIEQKAGKSIPDIFIQDGEIVFREYEIEVIKEIFSSKNQVIACGGGVVLNKINIDRLRQHSKIVCLTASVAVILKRVSGDGGARPLLDADDKTLEIQNLLNFRKPFYDRAADITITTSKMKINNVAEKIISKLKNNENFHQ